MTCIPNVVHRTLTTIIIMSLAGLLVSAAVAGAQPPDTTPPTITTVLSPAPNGMGWNNTVVTAVFTCHDDDSGVATCPSPVVFDDDGEDQTITVYATDNASNQGSALVTVNIDRVPPAVSITSPADPSSTSSSSVSVEGTVTDALSGMLECGGFPQPSWSHVVPDGVGGVLATWRLLSSEWDCEGSYQYDMVEKITRVTESVDEHTAGTRHIVIPEDPGPANLWDESGYPLKMVGDNGTAYVRDGDDIKAIDATTWDTLWTREASGDPITALDGGGVILHDPVMETLTEVDGTGDVVQTTSAPLHNPRSILGGQAALHGVDPVTMAAVEYMTVESIEAAYSFLAQGGNAQGRGQASVCKAPPFSALWKSLEAGLEFTHALAGTGWTDGDPSRQAQIDRQKNGIIDAFSKWTTSNQQSGLDTTFSPALISTRAIDLRKGSLGLGLNGRPVVGATSPDPSVVSGGGGTLTLTLLNATPANVYFSSDETLVSSETGYLKAALHEIGHLLGLGDNGNGNPRTSVMNLWSRKPTGEAFPFKDDPLRNIATTVNRCDREKAKDAPARSWP